jgi:PleD family two-component response regulator
MNVAPGSAMVLVAGDRAADAAHVQGALADEFARVEVSTRAELAVADFERVRPDVVVLAFDSIAKSKQYCLGLLRFSKIAQAHAHRYVILCAPGDLSEVFQLCKKDYFDDYVLYWPQPHDGHRLVMAVRNAARGLIAAQHLQPSREELVAHAASARALGDVVDRRLDEGLGHVAAMTASLAKVEREVGAAPAQAGVKRALAASRENLVPMSAWAAGFRAEVGPHVADAALLASKVASHRVVLVVEDDAFAAKMIVKALDGAFSVRVATEAPGLFELLRGTTPAVILMDINLPGMDGLALTQWLKASPTFSHIPVVMLTGEATRESIERSKAVGAADFIVKPFSRDALLAKLARVIG